MSYKLTRAVEDNNIERVRELIGGGDDIEYFSKSGPGRTPLSIAALEGYDDIVAFLIEAGANINAIDTALGFTPVAWAADQGRSTTVDLLIQAGADLDLTNNIVGLTPLMLAASIGHLEIVQKLVDAGADVTLQTTDDQNALSRARKHPGVAAYLQSIGVEALTKTVEVHLNWPPKADNPGDCDYSDPAFVLRRFILAMHEWETWAEATYGSGDVDWDELRKRESAAFSPYTTDRERKYGRDGNSFGSEPEYDPDEKLVSVETKKRSRIEIVTRQGSDRVFRHECKYVILKKAGGFLIDSKKVRTPHTEKWRTSIL